MKFLKSHASIIFIGILISLGLTGTVLGIVWSYTPSVEPSSWHQPIGTFLTQFCGSLLAVGLTAIFISLPDLRNYLTATVAKVLSGEEAISLFSNETKRDLLRRLQMDQITNEVSGVSPTLLRHVEMHSIDVLKSPYVTNFVSETNITEVVANPGLVRYNSSMSYRLHADYLKGSSDIDLVFEQSAVYPNPPPFEIDKWLINCTIQAGGQRWKREDVSIEKKELDGSAILLRAYFSKKVIVTGHTDVHVSAEFTSTSIDPIDITRARYPSQGLRATLHFSEGYVYECSWFKSAKTPYVSHDNINTFNLSNGIQSFTNDWLLPGEGVLLSFSKKP